MEISSLALADLSAWPRLGLKGGGAFAFARECDLFIPPRVNEAGVCARGGLVARLGVEELLLLEVHTHPGWCESIESAWAALRANGVNRRIGWPVPRQDTHAWMRIAGEKGPQMLAKLCAVDLRTHRFAPLQVVQTSVARIGAIVIRVDLGAVPAFHLLCDSSYAEYLWGCLVRAMAEYRGRIVEARASSTGSTPS